MKTPQYPKSILEKAKNIKLLICDVDGVLSDGKVYYSNLGDESKSFNIKDGLGIKQLINNGILVAIITGRKSEIVSKRAKELGITHLFQGKAEKQSAYQSLLNELSITENQVAHIGDDLPDLPLMIKSGLGVCVADGHYFVGQNADWITPSKGGCGAVRDVSDLLLFAQNKLESIHNCFISR